MCCHVAMHVALIFSTAQLPVVVVAFSGIPPIPSQGFASGVAKNVLTRFRNISGHAHDTSLVERLEEFEGTLKTSLQTGIGKAIPSKVDLDFDADVHAIGQEGRALLTKFGETLHFDLLNSMINGTGSAGGWTLLSIKSVNGDMCDDSNSRHRKGHVNQTEQFTPAWTQAPLIQKLLEPIAFSLRRVRLSKMLPNAQVTWHCDDCPYSRVSCNDDGSVSILGREHHYHDYHRLNLMLTSNPDLSFTYGGRTNHGTKSGNMFFSNIALPHRVDNKGDTERISLLVDIRVKGNEHRLSASALGRSILKAAKAFKVADADRIYAKILKALYKYRCGLTPQQRFETEWRSQPRRKPLVQMLFPFNIQKQQLFNSPNRCGIFGPAENQPRLALLEATPGKKQEKENIYRSKKFARREARELS
mmetsp:Transcript_30451/g.55333  ORF Transcript_30451/g.55333 Transcript_30451/m.55333 type:complete len:417 (-) Transcript_30451:25-1275(-)